MQFNQVHAEINTAKSPILSPIFMFSISAVFTSRKRFWDLFLKNLCERGTGAMKNCENEYVEYIYTAFITLKNGARIYARQYGLKAFRIPVKKRK